MPLLGPIDPLSVYQKDFGNGMQDAAEFGKAAQDASMNAADLQIKQLALRKQQEAEQRTTAFRAALAEVAKNPTTAGYNELQRLYPESAALVTPGLEKLDLDQKNAMIAQMVPAHNALLHSRPDLAVGHMKQIIQGYKSIGKPAEAAGAQTVLDTMQKDPALAAGTLGGSLSRLMGKDFDPYVKSLNLADTQRKTKAEADKEEALARKEAQNADDTQDLNASLVAQRGAATAKSLAETAALPALNASLIGQRDAAAAKDRAGAENVSVSEAGKKDARDTAAARLAFEKAKYAAQTYPETRKAYLESTNAIQDYRAKVTQVDTYIKGLKTVKPVAGFLGKIQDAGRGLLGWENAETTLKQQHNMLVTSRTLDLLPKGAASDTDVKLVREPFPAANASKETKLAFASSLKRVLEDVRDFHRLRAKWITTNKRLDSPSTKDIAVGPYKVSKGDSFEDFLVRSPSESTGAAKPTWIGAYEYPWPIRFRRRCGTPISLVA
jgi:hypothetical protein